MAYTEIKPFGNTQEMPNGYPIADNLITDSAQQALSAKQGKRLKGMIDALGSGGGEQWNGKKWWGFGTSITNTGNEGKYPTYLAAISGMTFVNHGFSGGGITSASNHAIYNDIMAVTSSCDADLITLEVGANDGSAPLGTIYDGLNGESVTDNSTFCGALNLCIRKLQATTDAQIVVMCSPHSRYQYGNKSNKYYGNETWASDNHTLIDVNEAIRKVCLINAVYYIPVGNMSGMGYARMNGSDGNDYIRDQIHHTDLGGYNFARAIWSHLKDIPLFYTAIPT